MQTPSDRVLARRPPVPNSTTLPAWRDNDVAPAHAAAVADVAALTVRRDSLMISGSSAAIDHAEVGLAVAGREVTRLALMRDAADAEIPRLAASERAATERLLAAAAAANDATLARRKRAGEELDDLFARVVSHITEERKVFELRRAFYRLHQSSPDLARAEVPISLVCDAIFAPNQGAGTIEQTIVALPAFSDPDAPSNRARHWPPVPPSVPQPPAQARPEAAPYVMRGRTVAQPGAPTPPAAAKHLGPRGLQSDTTYSDAAARALV